MENQEQEELKILTGKGYEFETILNGKVHRWNTGKITLGKMLKLSQVFIKMKIDESEIFNPELSIQIPAQYESVRENASLCAMAVAISVEGTTRDIYPYNFFNYLPGFIKKHIKKKSEEIPVSELQKHFLETLSSADLLSFTKEMLKNAELQNFMTSTVLMNGNRPTKAKPIEKTPQSPSTE